VLPPRKSTPTPKWRSVSGYEATTSAAASAPVDTLDAPNWVFNGTAIGIGVMRYWDGSYTMGKYDAVLPPRTFSDLHFGWQETRGVYIGPGYRGQIENAETGAVTNYGCSLNGHQIHLREGNFYLIQNVSRC